MPIAIRTAVRVSWYQVRTSLVLQYVMLAITRRCSAAVAADAAASIYVHRVIGALPFHVLSLAC